MYSKACNMKNTTQKTIIKILIGMSIVLGVIIIYKSGYKAGKWLFKKTNDTSVVKK